MIINYELSTVIYYKYNMFMANIESETIGQTPLILLCLGSAHFKS